MSDLPDAEAHKAQCRDAMDAFLAVLDSRPETRGTRWVWNALLERALKFPVQPAEQAQEWSRVRGGEG